MLFYANYTLMKKKHIAVSRPDIVDEAIHGLCKLLIASGNLFCNSVIIHCLEVSCKEDQITSAQRE